jgi:hypothetical protein
MITTRTSLLRRQRAEKQSAAWQEGPEALPESAIALLITLPSLRVWVHHRPVGRN